MKLAGELSINKVYTNQGDDYVQICVTDVNSRVEFLDVKIDMTTFAEKLCGVSNKTVELEFRNLTEVGKRYESKAFSFSVVMSEFSYNRDKIRDHIKANSRQLLADQGLDQKDGWKIDTYLGSQGSIVGNKVNTHVYRWVAQ